MEDGDAVLKRARADYGGYEEDVIVEILARLPVKSLMRFRCVCKSWRALISDPYFVKKHFSWRTETYKLNFNIDPPLFLDLKALKDVKNDNDVQLAVTRLDFPVSETIPHPSHRRIVGSCDGLICVEVSFKGIDSIMLWNPCTRDSKVLPNPPLVIEPKDSNYYYRGFGYDSATDDYKVMRGFAYDANGAEKFMTQILALKTGSWRTVKDIDYVELTERPGVFLNGALHWLGDLPDGDRRILSFDLGAEKFQETIPLPYDDWFTDLLIHRNRLCVFTRPAESNSIHIWMMKEYGVKESWTELVKFSLDNYVWVHHRHYFSPVCILENDVVLIDRLGSYEWLMVFSDLKEKTFDRFYHVSQGWCFGTVIYRETLVSPDIHTYRTNYVS